MKRTLRHPSIAGGLTAALLAAGTLGLAACGDEEPQIPRAQASELIDRLREAKRRAAQDPPVCDDLEDDTLPTLEDLVANLPEETDQDIRDTLEEGIEHLRDLVEGECTARRRERDKTDTTTETTPEPEPTPTPTPRPEPEPQPDPDPEPEPDPDPDPNPGNGDGDGNGNGTGGQPGGGGGGGSGGVAPPGQQKKLGKRVKR